MAESLECNFVLDDEFNPIHDDDASTGAATADEHKSKAAEGKSQSKRKAEATGEKRKKKKNKKNKMSKLSSVEKIDFEAIKTVDEQCNAFTSLFKYVTPELSDLERYGNQVVLPEHFHDKLQFNLSDKEDRNMLLLKMIEQDGLLSHDYYKAKAPPDIIIITRSALRACEIIKVINSNYRGRKLRICKLFAKHLKVEEQKALMQQETVNHISIGTPNRLNLLYQQESLVVSKAKTKLVILDMSYDVKHFNLLTMPNINSDLYQFYKNALHPLVVNGKLKLCLW